MADNTYIWGRHYRALIAQQARVCALDPHQLAIRCGWSNTVAFQRHRVFWEKGLAHRQALIPLAYLNAIEVDWCQLVRAVERDAEEFDRALEAMPLPASVITYGSPALGVTLREPLPRGLSLEEIYAHAQRLADAPESHWRKALLDWPSMKQVWFHAGRQPSEHLWRPRILVMGEQVDFGAPGFFGRPGQDTNLEAAS